MIDSIKEASKANAKGVLYAGLLGLLVSDILPTPADALYFYIERNLRDKMGGLAGIKLPEGFGDLPKS